MRGGGKFAHGIPPCLELSLIPLLSRVFTFALKDCGQEAEGAGDGSAHVLKPREAQGLSRHETGLS